MSYFYTEVRIHPYDGYAGEPIFSPKENSFVHFGPLDRCCTVPIRDRSEIIKELGLDEQLEK